jgi:predicted CXXCH cytochrome family protein
MRATLQPKPRLIFFRMTRQHAAHFVRALLVTCWCALVGPVLAAPEDAVCLPCHKAFATSPAAIASAPFGCVKCHSAADTAAVPHRNVGFFKGGNISRVSKTCLTCHDKPVFTQNKHDGIGAGCTGCHNAHAPKHGQLVTPEATTLCFSCHEKKEFEAKHVHDPVAEGSCTDCHAVHATEHAYQLAEHPTKVCLDCHKKVKNKPHATIDFAGKGHPIGGEKPGLMDPARPTEPFYCSSCHNPHMSQYAKLLRFDARSPMAFCQQCHKI